LKIIKVIKFVGLKIIMWNTEAWW